jgi:hypothetical protein
MPASLTPTIHGSACIAPSGSDPATDPGEDRHQLRDSLPLIECATVSRAKDQKRPPTGSSPFPAEPTALAAAILDALTVSSRLRQNANGVVYTNEVEFRSLLCRSSGGIAHHAATQTVGITEPTVGRVHLILPEGSRVAPTQSPVRSRAQMAKRQEAEQLDRYGHSF